MATVGAGQRHRCAFLELTLDGNGNAVRLSLALSPQQVTSQRIGYQLRKRVCVMLITSRACPARREGTLALSALLHKLGCSLSSVIRKQAGAGRVVDHLTRPTERRIAAVTAAAIINTPSAAVLDISATGTGKITQVINTRRKLIKDRLIAGKLLSMVPPRSGYIGWPLRARRVVKLTRLLNLPLPQLGRAPLAVDSKHFRHFNTCFPITRQSA